MATLLELAKDMFEAKRAEDEAKTKRIAAEEAIAALVETDDNGSKTVACGEGLKVTVKRALSYDADVEAIRALEIEKHPVTYVAPVGARFEFDFRAYEEMREKDPEAFKLVAQHVTTKPRKASVTLKLG